MPEICKPMDIEKRSFEIITELLDGRILDPENELVIPINRLSSGSSIPPPILITWTISVFPPTRYLRGSLPCGTAATS